MKVKIHYELHPSGVGFVRVKQVGSSIYCDRRKALPPDVKVVEGHTKSKRGSW